MPRGEIEALVRSTDWAKTPLGPRDSWPRSLTHYVTLILELPSPAIIFWGPEQIQIYNLGYAAIMGPRHPRYFGAPYKECWPDTYPLIYPWMRRVLDHGEVVEVEKTHITVTRYGFTEEAYFTFTFSPLRDDEGRIAGIYQPVFDVTGEVLSERRAQTLRSLEPRPESLDATADAMAAISANPNDLPFALVYLWNESQHTLELTARTQSVAHCERGLAELAKLARTAFDGGAAIEVDDADRLLEGARTGPWPEPAQRVLVLPLAQPNTDTARGVVVFGVSPRLHFDAPYRQFLELAAGQVARAIASVRARRARAELLEREQAARKEAERLRTEAEVAIRAKDEFLAMLGHELRNPLAPILTALQLLELKAPGVGERERDIMKRQVRHLVELVDDLLDVSRIARGKIELNREVVELAEVAADAIETASPLLEQRRHRLDVNVAKNDLAVRGDRRRLAQIVANLLTNAAKFTPPEGRISIVARREGDEAVLQVRDSGIGIDAELLPHIFDLFAQGQQSLNRAQGGLGLGLSIVKSLVEAHGGSVRAESAGNHQGTLITVRLPHVAIDRSERTHEERPPPIAPDKRRLRVLVVDDNEDAAHLLVEALSALGHEVRAAHDGPQALRLAEDGVPDVAVIDIGLPIMDGFEVARRFTLDPRLRRTRLIALTGYGQTSDRARSEAAGFAQHLVKPVDLEQLRAAIHARA